MLHTVDRIRSIVSLKGSQINLKDQLDSGFKRILSAKNKERNSGKRYEDFVKLKEVFDYDYKGHKTMKELVVIVSLWRSFSFYE